MLYSYSNPDIFYLTKYSKSFLGQIGYLTRPDWCNLIGLKMAKKWQKNHFKMQGNICPMKKLLGASNARGQTTKNLGFQSIQFENLQARDGPRRSGVSGAETKAFCSRFSHGHAYYDTS